MTGSPCVECGSTDTSLDRGGDGHFRKGCGGCGHEGGPYHSVTERGGPPDDGQAGLSDFT